METITDITIAQTQFTGGYDRGRRKDILEYRYGYGWIKVGTMMNVRSHHATSLVDFEDFADYCY